MILSGAPAISKIGLLNFIGGAVWDPTNKTLPLFGILPLILASLLATAGAIVIGVPIGLLTAVFLSQTAPPLLSKILVPRPACFWPVSPGYLRLFGRTDRSPHLLVFP
jgi:phosphate transport system permease protein